MSKEIVVQPQPRAWLEDSVLQPYVSRYGAHLRRGRYAPSYARQLGNDCSTPMPRPRQRCAEC